IEYKEIQIRPILEFQINCENLEASIEALDLSNIKDTICEVKLINLTTMQSIDINTADIKNIFNGAMFVNVKRKFKLSSETKTIDDIET
ncbi:DNA double-strand break repair protein Mre11, partial [Aliarcobacter butzleri]